MRLTGLELHARQHDLLVKQKVSLGQAIFRITLFKLFYYSYIIVLPILFSGMAWYFVIIGFLLMHLTAGLFLSCVFQPSHIVETSSFSLPVGIKGNRKMEDSWAVHEVVNTTDFAPRNRILSWFIGGLNYQIEHHLFPTMPRSNMRRAQLIVREYCAEIGVPYYETSIAQSYREILSFLHEIGKPLRTESVPG